jgi:glutamine amidotransferase
MAFAAMRIAALSLGVGNIRSVLRALDHAATETKQAAQITATADPDVVRSADVIVVPGQGSFGTFADAIDQRAGLRDVLVSRIRSGTPYFGVCLGLQILFDASEEAPGARGLGVMSGVVARLHPGIDPKTEAPRPLPHMGWNRVEPRDDVEDPLLRADHFYFAHTFAAPASSASTSATTEYGEAVFASAVRKDNVVGVQFHPEKSQRAGLALIARFFSSLK